TACSGANGINSSGTIAGSLDESGGGGCYAAFRLAGGVLDAIGPATSDRCSDAYAINDSGEIAGRVVQRGQAVDQAATWDANGQLHLLGTLGGSRGYALGMNNAGTVVGVSDAGTQPCLQVGSYWYRGHAFLYDGSTLQDLNGLNRSPGWELVQAS